MNIPPQPSIANKNIVYDFFLAINRTCNLACPYCYCQEHLSAHAIPTLDDIDTCLAFLKKIPQIGNITLIGGEPLFNQKQVIYILNALQQLYTERTHKFKIVIITNGTFYIDLKKYKAMISYMQISLNGFREEHNKYRKFTNTGLGSFDTIISNYRRYIADDITINFHCVVDTYTIRTIAPSLKKLITYIDIKNTPINVQISHYAPWAKHWLRLILLHYDIFKLSRNYPVYIIRAHISSFKRSSQVCAIGTTFFGIDLVSGKIYACHELCGTDKSIVGDLDRGISQAFINQYYTALDLKKYRFQGLPQWLSYWLLQKFPLDICPTHNIGHTKNEFIIPLFILLWSILSKLSRFMYRKNGLKLRAP